MKFYSLIIVIALSLNVASQESNTRKLFAEIKDDVLEFRYDTLLFKSFLVKNFYSDTAIRLKPGFDKVEIIRQLTFGECHDVYYSILVQDFEQNIRVAKWLTKDRNMLYLSDSCEKGDCLQAYYITCTGEESCFPEVGVENSIKYWSCGHDLICKPGYNCIKRISVLTP